jgi:hypothetical protein
MFRFTIRDLMWLMVAVGLGTGWWCEHQFVTKRSLRQRFELQAERWETWCKDILYSSVIDRRKHDAVDKLVAMGNGVIPLVFERWPEREGNHHARAIQPPWWTVLERLTGKKMVSDQEKLEGIPFVSDPDGIQMPGLEEERWRKWWEKEGKRGLAIRPSRSDENGARGEQQPPKSQGGKEI